MSDSRFLQQLAAAEKAHLAKLERLRKYAKANGVKLSPFITHDIIDIEVAPGADKDQVLRNIELILMERTCFCGEEATRASALYGPACDEHAPFDEPLPGYEDDK